MKKFNVKEFIPKIMLRMRPITHHISDNSGSNFDDENKVKSAGLESNRKLSDIQNEALNGLVDMFLNNNLSIKRKQKKLLKLIKICKECDDSWIEKFIYQVIAQGIISEEIIDRIWNSFLLEIDNKLSFNMYNIKILRISANFGLWYENLNNYLNKFFDQEKINIIERLITNELNSKLPNFLLVKEWFQIWVNSMSKNNITGK